MGSNCKKQKLQVFYSIKRRQVYKWLEDNILLERYLYHMYSHQPNLEGSSSTCIIHAKLKKRKCPLQELSYITITTVFPIFPILLMVYWIKLSCNKQKCAFWACADSESPDQISLTPNRITGYYWMYQWWRTEARRRLCMHRMTWICTFCACLKTLFCLTWPNGNWITN